MSVYIHCDPKSSKKTKEFCWELKQIIPQQKGNHTIKIKIKIIDHNNKPYLLKIKDHNNELDFKIINYKSKKHLKNLEEIFKDPPQLVVHNFVSEIGNQCALFFEKLFPLKIQGNQVVSFQNQNDFIFFRMYRYVFKEEKVVLMDIGPHFCLRLRRFKNENEEFLFRKHQKKEKVI